MKKKDFKFNKEGHYYTLDGKRMYGVTNVLSVIGGNKTNSLISWAAQMTAEFLKDKLEHIKQDNINQEEWEKLLDEAKSAHRKKKEAAGERGTDIHTLIEERINGAIKNNGGLFDPDAMDENEQVDNFIDWAIENKIKFLFAEKQMYSESLFVAGTCDFIFEKEGKTYIGDIKTYAKLWDRIPMLQCAGYGIMYNETFGKKVDGYCVIRVGKDGSFEEKWGLDTMGDTEGFLAAVRLFKCLENW